MGIMKDGITDKRSVMKRTETQSFERDDLKGAFAGKENKGPASKPKTGKSKSTNVKSRTTEKSKARDKVM